MEPIDSKLDLFQSLKNETLDSSDDGGPSTSFHARKLSEVKSEDDHEEEEEEDNLMDLEMLTSGATANVFDKAFKRKLDKQSRKELEEEEREKML
jgi:hypothetical protein